MTTSSRPSLGPVVDHARPWLARSLFLACALLGFGWSGHAAASLGCDIVDTSSSATQSGPANGTLTYSFDIVDMGGCSGTQSGNVNNTLDTTGGASSDVGAWSGTAGQTITVTITLGANSGSTSTWTVDCPTCGGSTVLNWTANTDDQYSLTADPPSSMTVLQGQWASMNAHYLRNGSDGGNSTNWNAAPAGGFFNLANPVFTDGATGLVSNQFISYADGTTTYDISVDGNPSECGALCPPTIHYSVTVEDPALSPVQPASGTATIAQNSSIVLKVKYAGPTLPVADGTWISWSVSSEPGVGAGTFSAQDGGPPSFKNTQTTGGYTQVTFNVTVAGTYVVDLCHQSDGCLSNDDKTSFTITVLPVTADLAITKTGSPDPVAPGGQLTYTIAVSNNGPNPSVQPAWSDTLPAQLSFVSLASPSGWRCVTPAPGAGGSISCSKNTLLVGAPASFTLVTTVAPTATPGSTISNTATVTSPADPNGANDSATAATLVGSAGPALAVVKLLTGTSDNDSSGSVTAGDQLDYQVTATNNGSTPLTNVVVSDDHFAATQACASVAPAGTCILTGSYIVTAADASAGSVTNVGSATSTEVAGPISSSVITPIGSFEPATLAVGSGDGQSTPVNTPFPQPLTVIAGGAPLPPPALARASTARGALAMAVAPGVTINWAVVSGSATLSAPSSVTNASGVASINAFAGPVAGPIVIRASRADDPSVTADFHLTATAVVEPLLGDLPGLTPNQKALADALDAFCSSSSSPALSATSQSSANLNDLLARCQELIDAIGTDPDGVIAALNELFADIALVQSESSLLAAESQFDNIKARIAALRSGTNRTSFGGLALNTSSGRLPIGSMFQSLLDSDTPAETKKEIGTDFSRWGFFAAGTIGRGKAEQGALSPAYDFDIDGLTVGADYRKSDKLIFGATLGYTKQTNDLTGRVGSLDTKGWSVSGYGTWYRQGSWYMDGVLSWGKNSYDVERRVHYTITGPLGTTTIDNTGHASGDGDSLSFALSVGRDFNKGGWGFGPYLRAMYTQMNFDTMTEDFDQSLPGNGLALELDTRKVTSLTSTLGGKLTYAHSTGWGVLIPHLQLEWQHEFETDPSEVEARFLFDPTGTPFTIHGDAVDTDFFRFGVGMSFVMTHGRSGFFYYERLISRDRFSQNSLALGIRLEF